MLKCGDRIKAIKDPFFEGAEGHLVDFKYGEGFHGTQCRREVLYKVKFDVGTEKWMTEYCVESTDA
jgi:hypothetical protein